MVTSERAFAYLSAYRDLVRLLICLLAIGYSSQQFCGQCFQLGGRSLGLKPAHRHLLSVLSSASLSFPILAVLFLNTTHVILALMLLVVHAIVMICMSRWLFVRFTQPSSDTQHSPMLQDPALFAPGKAPTEMSWARLEAILKALRDLQTDQQLDGGQERTIRDYPFIKRLMDNYQHGMARLTKE